MSFRFLSLSAMFLVACSADEEPASSDLGTPPSLSAGPQSNTQTVPSEWLLACGGTIRQLSAGVCSKTERPASSEDEGTLGFNAAAFLQLISGEHRARVSWDSRAAAGGRSSELVLTVQPRGDVRFVDQTMVASGHSQTFTFGNTGGRYYTCGDQLAVDAELNLMMPDGTLNETLQATIETESGRHARLLVNVPSSEVAGTLRVDVERAGADQLTLALGITQLGAGLEGSLGASHSEGSADLERSGSGCSTLGSFRLAEGCPLGAYPLSDLDDELLGLSLASVLERLNATSPTTLNDNGAPLELTFSAEPARQCVSVDTPATLPSVLMFPGSVALESSDGRVGGTLEVQLSAEAVNGSLQVVKAASEYLTPDARGLAAVAPRYAILEPLSWSRLELGGFEFQVEAREDMSGGMLRAIGGDLHCQSSQPCEEVCPGPGCSVSPAEKWAVRWGDMELGTDLSFRR